MNLAMSQAHECITLASALRHEYKTILEEVEAVLKYHPVGPQDSAGYMMAVNDFKKIIKGRSSSLDKIVRDYTTKTRKET